MTGRTVLVTDIAWPDLAVERELLEPLGYEVVLAPDGREETLVAAATEASAILTCFAKVTAAVIDAAPGLEIVARTGVGLDNIDVEACDRRGIPVTRVPDYCVDEVATHAVAMALSLWRELPRYDAALRAGRWGTDPQRLPLRRLAGARAAILGMGRIGSAVAARLRALGMEVGTEPDGADLVSVHLPLTGRTAGLVDSAFLGRLRPGAVLVNTGRGGVVDLDAVAAALDEGRLRAAGLDVFDPEPLPPDHHLRERDDVLLTPHVAFYSEQALAELRSRAARSVLDRLAKNGSPDA